MLSELFSSIGLGAITGIVGPIVTAITNYKMKKLSIEEKKNDRAHELLRIKAESDAVVVESQAKIEITKETVKGDIAKGELEAYVASLKQEESAFYESYMTSLPLWVQGIIAFLFALTDVIKKSARPVLTYYVMFAATWITYICWQILKDNEISTLDTATALDLFQKIVYFILYMASSAFSWWFVDRRMSKFAAKFLTK